MVRPSQHILVLDHEPVWLKALKSTLEAAGLKITTTSSATEALKLLRDRGAALDQGADGEEPSLAPLPEDRGRQPDRGGRLGDRLALFRALLAGAAILEAAGVRRRVEGDARPHKVSQEAERDAAVDRRAGREQAEVAVPWAAEARFGDDRARADLHAGDATGEDVMRLVERGVRLECVPGRDHHHVVPEPEASRAAA